MPAPAPPGAPGAPLSYVDSAGTRRPYQGRIDPERPALLVLDGPTLLDTAGELAQLARLWSDFTGQTTEEEHMHAKELTQLAAAVERRAGRVVEQARRNVEQTLPAAGNRAGAWAELSRKLISDELRSEWLRMHVGRRPKRAELALLARLFGQLDSAVQLAVEHVEPAAMPAAAGAAIVAFAAPVSAGR